jgi:hypothetical protein
MNITSTRAADGLLRRAFSVEDIRRMTEAGVINEDERIELIEGDIVVREPRTWVHERITWVHTGPAGDGWSSIVERGPQETLTTPALPDFAIKLGEID